MLNSVYIMRWGNTERDTEEFLALWRQERWCTIPSSRETFVSPDFYVSRQISRSEGKFQEQRDEMN